MLFRFNRVRITWNRIWGVDDFSWPVGSRISFGDLLETSKTQNEQWLQTPPMNWYRWISLIAYLFMAFAFIYFGARMIVENGFLKQNPIYLLLSQ
jgi:hypothetical protein